MLKEYRSDLNDENISRQKKVLRSIPHRLLMRDIADLGIIESSARMRIEYLDVGNDRALILKKDKIQQSIKEITKVINIHKWKGITRLNISCNGSTDSEIKTIIKGTEKNIAGLQKLTLNLY